MSPDRHSELENKEIKNITLFQWRYKWIIVREFLQQFFTIWSFSLFNLFSRRYQFLSSYIALTKRSSRMRRWCGNVKWSIWSGAISGDEESKRREVRSGRRDEWPRAVFTCSAHCRVVICGQVGLWGQVRARRVKSVPPRRAAPANPFLLMHGPAVRWLLLIEKSIVVKIRSQQGALGRRPFIQ